MKVKIKKPTLEEELLVEDIKNIGLPPIIITTILGEFSGQSFDTKKSQDVVGRMYKEKSKISQGIVSDLIDDTRNAIEFIAEIAFRGQSATAKGGDDWRDGVPTEFTQGFNKIVKYNVINKSSQEFFYFFVSHLCGQRQTQNLLILFHKSNMKFF